MIVYRVYSEFLGYEIIASPKIPKNYMTLKGYEDNHTKRVCLCKTVDDCLTALSNDLEDTVFYVYTADIENVYYPTIDELPDVELTGELWGFNDLKMKYVKTIKVSNKHIKDGFYCVNGEKKISYIWDYDTV